MTQRIIDEFGKERLSRSHSRSIDHEETLRIVDDEPDDLNLDDDDTDPGDRRRDPLRQPV